MGKIIAVANQKGGVGKTTTAINLAASLAVLEYRILLVDADPQANATSGVGVTLEEDSVHLYDCLINEHDAKDAIVPSKTPFLDVLPAHIDLVGAEIELSQQSRREYRMQEILESVREDYDFIFVDCLPSLGLITINALVAADSVLVPVQCEIFAFEGLSKLKNTINLVKAGLNPDLEIEGILLSMYDRRLRLANIVVEEVQSHSTDRVFETIIHRNSRVSEAPSMHQPVVLYDAACTGSVNFINLAQEFLSNNQSWLEKPEPANI